MATVTSEVSGFEQAMSIARSALRFPETALQVVLDAAADHVGAQAAWAFHVTKQSVTMLARSGNGHRASNEPASIDESTYVRALVEGDQVNPPSEWAERDWCAHAGRPMQADGYTVAVFVGSGLGPTTQPEDIRDELSLFMTLAALGAENDRVMAELDDMRKNRAILDATFRHDLRHPLQAITGAAALLSDVDRPLDDSDRVELLAMISSESERLNVMLDATFADSVGHDHIPPKLECIEIKELVTTVAAGGRSANFGRISLDVEQSKLTTDPARLGRALRNLIDNALKYAPAEDTVDILGRVTGDDYVIQVIDGGPGVEPQLVHRLFTPFFRDTDRIDSTGLGLASVARLVESLGGRATYSRAERTVFEIVVPRDSSQKGTHETR